MKRLATSLLLMLSVFLLSPSPADAAKVDVSSALEHTAELTFNQNTYGVGLSANSAATFQKDVFFAAVSSIVFSGTTSEDAIFVGGDVRVTGTINEDLRALGGVVRLSGDVGGDVVMLGGSLIIEEGATIGGDVVVVGGTVSLEAPILTRTNIVAGSATFKNVIESKNVIATAYRLDLEEGAKVNGSITYFAPKQITKDESVLVNGTVAYHRINPLEEDGLIDQAVVSFLNFWVVLRFITTLVLAFLLVFVFRVFTQRTVDVAQHNFGKSLLCGILSLFFIPLVFIILILSLILFPVAILLVLVSMFFWIIAGAVAGIIVGVLVRKFFKVLRTEDEQEASQLKQQKFEVSFNSAVIGVILLTLVEFVPYIGDVVRIIFVLTAFGGLWYTLYKYVRWGSLFMSFKKK